MNLFLAKGIIELETRGAYAGALIKKRRYLPKNVPGDSIDSHFVDKDVGYVDMLESKIDERKTFRIFALNSQILSQR